MRVFLRGLLKVAGSKGISIWPAELAVQVEGFHSAGTSTMEAGYRWAERRKGE